MKGRRLFIIEHSLMDYQINDFSNSCEKCIFTARPSANDEQESQTSPLFGKIFVLIGSGGAGRALAFGAKSRGARIFIFDIDYGTERCLLIS